MGQTPPKQRPNSSNPPSKLKTQKSIPSKDKKRGSQLKRKSFSQNRYLFISIPQVKSPILKDFSFSRQEKPFLDKLFQTLKVEFIDVLATPNKKFNLDIEILNEKASFSFRWGPIISLITDNINNVNQEKSFKAFEDNLDNKTHSVMKVFPMKSIDFRDKLLKLTNEVYILSKINEKHLDITPHTKSTLLLEDNAKNPKALILFEESYEFTLKEMLEFRRKNGLIYKENELLTIMKQIILMLKKLFEEFGLYHRDIRPENFIYSIKHERYNITGLNNAILTKDDSNDYLKQDLKGTPFYMTPENYDSYMRKEEKNKTPLMQNDLYALGVVFLLMKKGLTLEEMVREDIQKTKALLLKDHSLSAKIILNMLEDSPEARPSYFSLYGKFSNLKEEKCPETVLCVKLLEYIQNSMNDPRKKAENSLEIGIVYLLTSQLDKAVEKLSESKELFVSLKDDNKKAIAMYNLGLVYSKLDLLDKAAAELEPSLPLAKRLYGQYDENISKALDALARYCQQKRKLVDSITYNEENILNIEHREGAFSLNLARINENLGDIYEELKIEEEACKRWNEAIVILKKNDETMQSESINKLYNKIYKFHPSEMYDENESCISPKNEKEIESYNEKPIINIDRGDSVGSKNGHREIHHSSFKEKQKNINNNNDIKIISSSQDLQFPEKNNEIKMFGAGQDLKIPDKKQEKIKKSANFSGFNEENLKKHEENFEEPKSHAIEDRNKSKDIIFVSKDEDFEKSLLDIKLGNFAFSHNLNKVIQYTQCESEFKKNSLERKDQSLVFQNDFLKICSKNTLQRKTDTDYDIMFEISYENTSKITNIENIFVKFQNENHGVFLNVQQLKARALETQQIITHSIFVKFKAFKYEMPVIFFFGSIKGKEICVVYRLPCTLFSKLFNDEIYCILQYHKLQEVVLPVNFCYFKKWFIKNYLKNEQERINILETQSFIPSKGIISKLEDFHQYFQGKTDESGKVFETMSYLHFKETTMKFLLQVNAFQGKMHFRIIYLAFGAEDFLEKKSLFIELLKTLIFLFT